MENRRDKWTKVLNAVHEEYEERSKLDFYVIRTLRGKLTHTYLPHTFTDTQTRTRRSTDKWTHTRYILYTYKNIYPEIYWSSRCSFDALWFFKRIPFSSEYLAAHTNFFQNWNGRFSRGWREIRETIKIRTTRTNAIVERKEWKRSLVRRSMHTRTSTDKHVSSILVA